MWFLLPYVVSNSHSLSFKPDVGFHFPLSPLSAAVLSVLLKIKTY